MWCRKLSLPSPRLLPLAASLALLLLTAQHGIAGDPTADTIKKATKLARKGDLTGAEGIYRKALANDPDNNDLKAELAYNLVRQRRVVEGYQTIYPIAVSQPDRKSTRLNSSHTDISRMPSSA